MRVQRDLQDARCDRGNVNLMHGIRLVFPASPLLHFAFIRKHETAKMSPSNPPINPSLTGTTRQQARGSAGLAVTHEQALIIPPSIADNLSDVNKKIIYTDILSTGKSWRLIMSILAGID